MSNVNISSGKQANPSEHPRKWWQWFLVYPVLASSLIAAIPTYLETIRAKNYDVAFGQSKIAEEQDDLWRTNLECTSAPLDLFVNANNVKVDATICKSGDVLVKVFSPDGKTSYKWVAVNNVIKEEVNAGLISAAYASSTPQPILVALNGDVICQRYLEPGRVLRRTSVNGRGCFDEIVNTYTGRVESTSPAPCSTEC